MRRGACSTTSSSAIPRWRHSTAPTRRSWSPSGPSSPSSTGPRPPSGWRGRCLIDGRNFLDSSLLRQRRLRVRGHRQGGRGLGACGNRGLVQAIVLVGGEGTRLRPLTETVPKPALTLVDRPFLAYMIEWLARARGHRGGARLRLPARRAAARRSPARRSGRGSRSATWSSPIAAAPPERSASPPTSSATGSRTAFSPSTATSSPTSISAALLGAHARARGAGDARPAPGRGLLRLRPGAQRRGGGGPRVPREDRGARCRARSTPGCTCSSARCST